MQEFWNQLVQSYPALQSIWNNLKIIFPLSALLAFAGVIFISATAKTLFITRQRSALDKCSRQLALLGLWLGWPLLIGGRIWLYQTPPPEGGIESFIFEMSWLLLSLGVLLTTIYYSLWKILKNMPVLHVTLGMLTAVQNCVALSVILFAARVSSLSYAPLIGSEPLPPLFPGEWGDQIWSAAAYSVPLVFGMAGAFSVFWVSGRKSADDYGRDHYNAMIPWLAAWARNSWLVVWLLFLAGAALKIWTNFNDEAVAQYALRAGVQAGVWLIPFATWSVVAASKTPMRFRWALCVAMGLAMSFTLPYFAEFTAVSVPEQISPAP